MKFDTIIKVLESEFYDHSEREIKLQLRNAIISVRNASKLIDAKKLKTKREDERAARLKREEERKKREEKRKRA